MLKLDFEQEKIKEQERLQKKIEKNKKIIFMSGFCILIAVLLLVILVAFIKISDKPKVIIDNTKVNLTHVNGKLAKYIENLGNTYTIRYLGEFGPNSWNDEIKQATIEYTREGSKSAIYSEELNRHVVISGDNVYSIVKVYKVIVEAKKPVDFSASEYNLLSDFGQRYVADVEVKESGVEYVYQEYTHQNAKIRYYFVGDDLRHIKIITGDVERKINVIVTRKTVKRELFELPEGYKRTKA